MYSFTFLCTVYMIWTPPSSIYLHLLYTVFTIYTPSSSLLRLRMDPDADPVSKLPIHIPNIMALLGLEMLQPHQPLTTLIRLPNTRFNNLPLIIILQHLPRTRQMRFIDRRRESPWWTAGVERLVGWEFETNQFTGWSEEGGVSLGPCWTERGWEGGEELMWVLAFEEGGHSWVFKPRKWMVGAFLNYALWLRNPSIIGLCC